MFARVFFVLILFIVSGCLSTGTTTLDKSYHFDSKANEGFFVLDNVEAMPMGRGQKHYIYIQAVDVPNRKFTGSTIGVASCGICVAFVKPFYFGDVSQKSDLQAILLSPGYYAITATTVTRPRLRTVTCYSKGTRLFEIKAGTIGLYPSRFPQFQSDSDRLIKLKGYLVEYPQITGKVEMVKTAGKITFEGSKKFIGEDCAYSAGNWFVLHDDKGAIVN